VITPASKKPKPVYQKLCPAHTLTHGNAGFPVLHSTVGFFSTSDSRKPTFTVVEPDAVKCEQCNELKLDNTTALNVG